jgi:DNA-directed RNA polymerase subunit RPC12/RpoP
MMPAPTHLRDCVLPGDARIDETGFFGKVRCPCGSESFRLLYPGETHEYRGVAIPCTAQVNGHFFFLVKAACANCGREHLLIDKDFHGWDGFVCHDAKQASLPRPSLRPWKCLKCGGTDHSASVSIETQGRQDFIEEAGEGFDPERWPDAFSWFTMAIRCVNCGKETPSWVALETM